MIHHCANNGCMNDIIVGVESFTACETAYSAGYWLIGSEEICRRVSFTYPGSDAGSSVVESPDARQLAASPSKVYKICVFRTFEF
jgi:hypothetical protein